MIYDCFSFFNELDVLEIRLSTLNEIVDKFVLVEAPWTHTGKPKPLYFEENKARFAPFLDKVIHIVASDPPVSSDRTERENAWIRENWQRNEIKRGLTGAKPDDLLIIADLDEIPKPEIVSCLAANPPQGIANLNLKNYAYFLNNLNIAMPVWSGGPQALTFSTFNFPANYAKAKFTEYCPECVNPTPSATLVRFLPRAETLRDAGWHFSYMGGVEAVRKKLLAYAHNEYQSLANDPDLLRKRIENGEDVFGERNRFMAEPINHDFPKVIKANPERYAAFLLPASEEEWRKGAMKRRYYRIRKTAYDKLIGLAIAATPQFLHPLMRKLRKLLGL